MEKGQKRRRETTVADVPGSSAVKAEGGQTRIGAKLEERFDESGDGTVNEEKHSAGETERTPAAVAADDCDIRRRDLGDLKGKARATKRKELFKVDAANKHIFPVWRRMFRRSKRKKNRLRSLQEMREPPPPMLPPRSR